MNQRLLLSLVYLSHISIFLRKLTNKNAEKPGNASDSEHVFHLLVRPKDETAELWDGARSGMQAAQDVFNADEVLLWRWL